MNGKKLGSDIVEEVSEYCGVSTFVQIIFPEYME